MSGVLEDLFLHDTCGKIWQFGRGVLDGLRDHLLLSWKELCSIWDHASLGVWGEYHDTNLIKRVQGSGVFFWTRKFASSLSVWTIIRNCGFN